MNSEHILKILFLQQSSSNLGPIFTKWNATSVQQGKAIALKRYSKSEHYIYMFDTIPIIV